MSYIPKMSYLGGLKIRISASAILGALDKLNRIPHLECRIMEAGKR